MTLFSFEVDSEEKEEVEEAVAFCPSSLSSILRYLIAPSWPCDAALFHHSLAFFKFLLTPWFEAMHESQTTMTWGPCVINFFMANLPDSIDPNGGKMGCRAGEEDFLDGNFGQGTDGLKTKSGDVALCCVDSIFLGAIRTKQVTPEQVRGYYDTMFPTSGTTTTTTVCYQVLSITTMYHLLLAAVIIIIYCYHLLLFIPICCYLLLSSGRKERWRFRG